MKIAQNYANHRLILFAAMAIALCLGGGPALANSPQDLQKILSDGERLIAKNLPQEALQLFTKALEEVGENAELLRAAGKAAFLGNDFGTSTQHLFAAQALMPEDYEVNLFLGKALKFQGQEMTADTMTQKDGFMMMEDSLKFTRKAVELNQESAEPCMDLAYTLYTLYDFVGADEAAAKALERDPASTETLLLRGDLAYNSYTQALGAGAPAEESDAILTNAITFYTDAAKRDEMQTRSHMGMGSLYEWAQKWNEAAQAYHQALLRDPELIQAYARLLIVFRKDNVEGKLSSNLDEIIALMEKQFPDDAARRATPYYYQAIAYMQEGDYVKCKETLDKSLTLNPQFEAAVDYYRFRAAYESGDRNAAADKLISMLRVNLNSLVYFMQNDSEFTSKVYMAVRFIAFDLGNAGRTEDARDLNACLLTLVTNDASLYNDYALGCRETRSYEEAYNAYVQAIALDSENPIYLNDAALILQYYLRRDLDEAERLYTLSLEKAQYRLDNEADFSQVQLDDARLALRDAGNNLNLLQQGITEWPDSPPQPPQ